MLCPNCGADLGNRQIKFCPYCGKSVLAAAPQTKPEPKPQPVPRPNPNPTTRPVPRPNPNPAPRPVPGPNSNPAPRLVPGPNSNPAPRPVPGPNPNPVPRPAPRPNPTPVPPGKPGDTAGKVPVNPDKPQMPVREKPVAKPAGKNKKVLLIAILAVVILAVLAVGAVFGIRWLKSVSANLPNLIENAIDSDRDASLNDDQEGNVPTAEEPNASTENTNTEATETAEETSPAPVLMPNMVGMNYSSAVSMLSSLGCTVTFEYEFSDTVEKDIVLTQSVAADNPLPESRSVVLWVSQGPDVSPDGYDQKVVVTAGSGSSYGTLAFYEWEGGQWVSKFSCDATVGKNGISTNYGEGKGRTPQGVFKLGIALSANSIPNSGWPFRQVSSSTCVVDDVDSIYYNTIQNKNNLSSGTSYDPIGNTIVKGYSTVCIYIEHNGNGIDSDNVVPGMGSVITVCGRSGSLKPTAGCVDISSSNMTTLLGLLDYNKNPHIEIYVE